MGVQALIGALLAFASSLVGRVMLAMGLGFVEYQGVNYLMQEALQYAAGGVAEFGASPLAMWAGFFKIDIHFSIAVSAITVKILLSTWITGAKQIVSK